MNDEHQDLEQDPSMGQGENTTRNKDLLQDTDQQLSPGDMPVVGIGASAGGLDALKAFFAQVSQKSGMAYIVVMHLAPHQPSMLPELLQKVTAIPVTVASDGQSLLPDHVYVVPPRKEVSMYNGVIQLLDPAEEVFSLPIDFFFRSLAADRAFKAAAVILSGTGSDGSVGLRDIKDSEGLVLVQSEGTAKYDGMPHSALATGMVDMVLAPEEMPSKLISYFEQPGEVQAKEVDEVNNKDWLHKIFALLRIQTGHDFSWYKSKTILRRINRRMLLNQIQEYNTYLSFLRQDSKEITALFKELLIGVTNFFRDPDSFDILKKEVLPEILASLQDDTTFRVWVPGCSSGEEVYSLAMVILEALDDFPKKRVNLQMFGTDIDKEAIDRAREGFYPSSIRADVSQDRLNRFFDSEGDGYRIRKEIRETMIYSVQNVLKDPPFSRLNLLCCRNLLIYLNTEAQQRLLPLFHYTLLPGGVLMLGSSETVGSSKNLFETLDTTGKIYRRREVPKSMLGRIEFPTGQPEQTTEERTPGEKIQPSKDNVERLTRKMVLDRFAPPAVLIDSQGSVLQVQGRTGKYLEIASGPPTQNILDLAREGLRVELSMAIRKAVSSQEEVIRHQVEVQVNGGMQTINLHVIPIEKPKELSNRLLVVFEDIQLPAQDSEIKPSQLSASASDYQTRIAELEQELQETRESHHATVEELESSNEELKTANEELQSSNEELQSTNEELESSKEELQSLNEELQTVNSELQAKVEELSEAHDDINNLLNSTQIATVFVDNNLQVKRFSKEATKVIHLIRSDIGRPLEHQSTKLENVDLARDIKEVLDKLSPVGKEVQTSDATWYMLRIMPYRTRDNRIHGAVIIFQDIDDQKKIQEKLRQVNEQFEQAWHLTRRVFDMNPSPLAVLDDQARVIIANTSLCQVLGLPMDKIEGQKFFSLNRIEEKNKDLQHKLNAALEGDQNFETRAFKLDSSEGGKTYTIQGSIIGQEEGKRPYRILLQFKES
ncbi:MAG: CheR family methyltransferase [Desulfovermiculus sp.]